MNIWLEVNVLAYPSAILAQCILGSSSYCHTPAFSLEMGIKPNNEGSGSVIVIVQGPIFEKIVRQAYDNANFPKKILWQSYEQS